MELAGPRRRTQGSLIIAAVLTGWIRSSRASRTGSRGRRRSLADALSTPAENFSRTCWMTFQVRGVVSRLSVVSSLSLDIRPEIGRCSCAMRHWVVLSAR